MKCILYISNVVEICDVILLHSTRQNNKNKYELNMSRLGGKHIGESDWKPHNHNFETNPSTRICTTRDPGPDWTSSLRCLPNISSENVKAEYSSHLKTGRRHFPWVFEQSTTEWSYYSEGSSFGKRCFIDGTHKGNMQTVQEIQLEKVMGFHRRVRDSRGGLPYLSPGDKNYSVPEYSRRFHQEGSTLPAINFSRTNELLADTFIPIQPLPKYPSMTYNEKEMTRKLMEEEDEVLELNNWIAAPPITATI